MGKMELFKCGVIFKAFQRWRFGQPPEVAYARAYLKSCFKPHEHSTTAESIPVLVLYQSPPGSYAYITHPVDKRKPEDKRREQALLVEGANSLGRSASWPQSAVYGPDA